MDFPAETLSLFDYAAFQMFACIAYQTNMKGADLLNLAQVILLYRSDRILKKIVGISKEVWMSSGPTREIYKKIKK